MATLRLLPRDVRLVAAAAALGLTLLAVAAGVRFGAAALAIPALAFAATGLLARPAVAVGLLLVVVIVSEPTGDGVLGRQLEYAYADLPGGPIPIDLLLLIATAAVGLDLLRRREEPTLPPILGAPIALLAIAGFMGMVVGYSNGSDVKGTIFAGHALPYLLLTPILVASVVRTRAQAKRAMALIVGSAFVKALLGIGAVFAGLGEQVEGAVITYYEATANWLGVLAMLGAAAALITGVRPPARFLYLTGALSLVSVVLSQRRSFWLGAIFGLVLLVIIGASRFGRRLIVPGLAILAGMLWFLAGSAGQLEGPIAKRAESLRPSAVRANAQDRYRLDERANVVAELRKHPITGLGLNVDWSAAARSLPIENEDGRQYVHTLVLWHWLKLGILGLLGILALYIAALRMGWRVWRRIDDPYLRAAGLAALTGLACLFLVETTGSFTGVEERMSTLFGAVCGWLAAVLAAPAPDDAVTESRDAAAP